MSIVPELCCLLCAFLLRMIRFLRMTGVLIGDLTVSAADLSMSATQFVTQGRTLISTPRSAIASTTQKQLTTLAGRGEDDEYRGRKVQGGVGWTRLIAGGRKRRAAAVAAGPGRGSRGRGTSSGAAGDGDGRGLDWTQTEE